MPAQQPQELRKTEIEREARKVLQDARLQIGSTVMAEKRAVARKSDQDDVVLTTNIYGIKMKDVRVYRYDVTIYGYTMRERKVELTKKVFNDYTKIDRRVKCRDVMTAFKKLYADFLLLEQSNCLYYDLQAIMYSLKPLNVDAESGNLFGIPLNFVPSNDGFVRFEVLIKCISENRASILRLGNLSHVTRDVGDIDQSLEQFLNLATSQDIMFNNEDHVTFSTSSSFLLDPIKYGFQPNDLPLFPDNGTYLAVGAQKGVRFIEGPSSGGFASLVVEVKKTAFHNVELVLQKAVRFVADAKNLYTNALTNVERERLNRQLKGLIVQRVYGSQKDFLVDCLSTKSALEQKFLFKNRELSVFEYMLEHYNLTLEYPKAPLIEAKFSGGRTDYFPMELVLVSDNQRVRSHQQTPLQTQQMIKKCAVDPIVLRNQLHLTTNSLNLIDSEYLRSGKMSMIESPLRVTAHLVIPPSISYAKGALADVNSKSFTWMSFDYLVPAECKKWAAYCLTGGTREVLREQDYSSFLVRFLGEARARGMRMADPADMRFGNADPEELKHEISLAAANACEFVLVVHPDGSDEIHAALKLCERNYQVTTQGLKMSTVRNVIMKGQPQTLQNIVHKTNIKLGGINYSLSMNSSISQKVLGTDTLFIGFGMNHPVRVFFDDNNGANHSNGEGGATSGGMVGSAGDGNGSNTGNGSSDHSRDIFTKRMPSVVGEPCRDEKVTIIRGVVQRCVIAYRQNRNKEPKRVIVYRNGCSDGQYANVLRYEVPLMKHALKELHCKAPLTVIVSNKIQNVRLFKENINPTDKSPDQNIRPGTVVESCVVHPQYCEFFLTSHRAIQGTARTPKYTVLYDGNQLSMDDLEGITYHLCYGHQIVQVPTSIPSPVYIAVRYAERGSLLCRRYMTGSSSDTNPHTYSELTERLCYEYVDRFKHIRISA